MILAMLEVEDASVPWMDDKCMPRASIYAYMRVNDSLHRLQIQQDYSEIVLWCHRIGTGRTGMRTGKNPCALLGCR
jgi:hypothetical protein